MWPNWAKNLDYDFITRIAVSHQLDPKLIAAIVETESSGNTYACRYEPNFRYTYQVQEMARICWCTPQTMLLMQKTSWGLMQVMGAVAYEHGLADEYNRKRKWPTALTNPAIGLKYGCLHLKLKYEKYGPDLQKVYAAYNAGSPRYRDDGTFINQEAVNRFLRFYKDLRP